MKLNLFLGLFLMLFMLSCRKRETAGVGGNCDLYVHVKHHNLVIDSATVFLKFNAQDFPADSSYDLQAEVENSNGENVAIFKGLKNGSYYAFAHGWDFSIFEHVEGALPTELGSKEQRIDITIQVTEAGH